MKRFFSIGILAFGIAIGGASHVEAQAPQIRPMADIPAYHQLDFWVGDWTVAYTANHERCGTNHIEKVLKGAAIIENWTDSTGGEGKSLFYFHRAERRWKQVWVTDVGLIKEKALVEELPGGGVRFSGELPLGGGKHVTDRTTLTPLPTGEVRQLIEWSEDGGQTWKAMFDAIYTRVKQ